MAGHLAAIHGVNGIGSDLEFLPKQRQRLLKWLDDRPVNPVPVFDEGHALKTLKSEWPLSRMDQGSLLHGDYWPGNILWKDGEIVAVIDWEETKANEKLRLFVNLALEKISGMRAGRARRQI